MELSLIGKIKSDKEDRIWEDTICPLITCTLRVRLVHLFPCDLETWPHVCTWGRLLLPEASAAARPFPVNEEKVN